MLKLYCWRRLREHRVSRSSCEPVVRRHSQRLPVVSCSCCDHLLSSGSHLGSFGGESFSPFLLPLSQLLQYERRDATRLQELAARGSKSLLVQIQHQSRIGRKEHVSDASTLQNCRCPSSAGVRAAARSGEGSASNVDCPYLACQGRHLPSPTLGAVNDCHLPRNDFGHRQRRWQTTP